MLTPEQLDVVADGALRAFAELDSDMRAIVAIALTDPASANRDAVRRAITAASYSGKRDIERAIADALTGATRTSMRSDEARYAAARVAGIIAPYTPIATSATVTHLLRDGVATVTSLGNLVRTSAEQAIFAEFIDALDSAMLGITSGAVAPDVAIREAVKAVATTTTKVTYTAASGARVEQGIYGAVRRAVLTGANQTTQRISLARGLEVGATTWEVSAHMGARPEHAEWQGGIYTTDELSTICGYGEGEGLAGWNCRHSALPFFPGLNEPTDTSWADDPGGTQYALSQRQRECERHIRDYKGRAKVYRAAGDKEAAAKSTALSRKWQGEADSVAAQRQGARRRSREVGE